MRSLTLLVALLAGPVTAQGSDGEEPELEPELEEAARGLDAREDPVLEGLRRALARFDFHGDARFRVQESFRLDHTAANTRYLARLRLGARFRVAETLHLGARLATGDPDDPRDPDLELGDLFDSHSISIDRAHVDWTPRGGPLWLTFGKFGHPFRQNPIYGELAWDADVQPEGVAGGLLWRDAGPFEEIAVTLGEYIALNQVSADEFSLFVAQAAATARLADPVSLSTAVGLYRYTDPDVDDNKLVSAENPPVEGNEVADTDGDNSLEFFSNFTILNPIVALRFDGPVPVTLAGEYLLNTRAAFGQDQGGAAGFRVGEARARGDWELYYQWQLVEQEAVFAPFAQNDFVLTTDHRSHLVGVRWRAFEHALVHLAVMVSERLDTDPDMIDTDSDRKQWRVRLDLSAFF